MTTFFQWAADGDADLRAIYVYVESQRPHIPQFPKLQSAIEKFEQWYQGLTFWDINVMIGDTVKEALRQKALVDAAQNAFPDPTAVPADRIAPGHTAPGTTTLPGNKPPLIPTKYKFAVTVGAGALAALVLLKKLHIL